MTGAEFENGVNNILDNTPQRGVSGSAGITKTVLKQIVAFFKTLLNDVNAIYDAGLFWRGAWSAATAYNVRDVVSLNGSTYRCKAAHTNQAVTNTTFWEIVAAKGTDGNAVVNRGGSLYNLLTDTSIGATIDTASDVVPVAVFTHTGASQGFYSNILIPVRLDRLYMMEFEAVRSVAGDLYVGVSAFNKSGSTVAAPYGASANTTVWAKYSIVFGGPSGASAAKFTSDTVNVRVSIVSYLANTFRIKNLVFREIALSEPIQHNLSLAIPAGQTVFHASNPSQLGMMQSDGQIAWFSGQEVVLEPNGTAVVYNLRRGYKFTWAVVYNNGVTIVSQPAAVIAANADANLSLTGTAGKTFTIVIYPCV